MGEHAEVWVRLAAVGVVIGLLAGCGGDGAGPADGGTPGSGRTPHAPASDPPTLGGAGEPPPPAWVAASSESVWMAYGSYCWGRACVDMLGPAQRDDLPRLRVQPGEEMTFRLGFDPAALVLSVAADGQHEQVSVPARRDVTWQATRGGVVSLFARADGRGGDASYLVRVVVERSEGSQMVSPAVARWARAADTSVSAV